MINLELINHGDKETGTIDIKAIVSKPVERLQYSAYIDDRSVAIAYIDSTEINSKDHLEVNDLSWKVKNNNSNLFEEIKEFEIERESFTTNYRDLLITNVVDSNVDGFDIPLYYKHKRKVKEASLHFIENGDEIDVDSGFKIVDGWIYTNYKNIFNKENGNYAIFFVEGVDENLNAFNELLSIVPAIEEASWENIDLETGQFENLTYTRDLVSDRYYYQISNPISRCGEKGYSSSYFVKLEENNLIKIKKPYQYSLENPWFLEVTNGFIYDSNNRYSIPEYRNQAFEMESGLLRLVNKQCNFVTSNLIQLPANPVKIDPSNNLNITVTIRNSFKEIIKALTTESTLLGTKIPDTDVTYEEGISSWDFESGIVELETIINPSQVIEATFFYKTNNLLFNELNVNLYTNKKLIYNNLFLYLIPNQNSKSVYYFLVDEEDRIIKTSNPKFDVFYNNSYNSNNMIGKSLKYFKETYCAGWENNYKYMPLGMVSLKEDFYVEDINEVDIREKSYLNSNNFKDYFNKQHKGLQSKFGYGDEGQVIQKNNLVYVKYPIELLNKYGGNYTEGQLIRATKRKLPNDVDIVVDYHYLKSSLTFTVNALDITINASWEGPGTYRIEKSLSEFGEKTQIHSFTSTTEETLSYVDSSVENGKTYWYWIRIDEYPRSNTYGVYKS